MSIDSNFRSNFSKALKSSSKQLLYGEIGATIRGRKIVEVPGRDGFVYVRLRNNPSEFIQAYNDSVQNLYYDVPVVLRRVGNRYVVISRDIERYPQWYVQDPSNGGGTNAQQITTVLRHGSTHAFDITNPQGGGDIAWIYSRQFMPGLVSPYNENSPNVYIAPTVIQRRDGNWLWVGNTGTQNLIDYVPSTGTTMILVAIDSRTGNPSLVFNSGTSSPIPAGLTGTEQILKYMPTWDNPDIIPLSLVRLEQGEARIGWDNLTDVRNFVNPGSAITVNGTSVVSNLSFPNSSAFFSGTSAFIEFIAKSGKPSNDVFYFDGALTTGMYVDSYPIVENSKIDGFFMFLENSGVTGSTKCDIYIHRTGSISSVFGENYLEVVGGSQQIDYKPSQINEFYPGDRLLLSILEVAEESDSMRILSYSSGTYNVGMSVEDSLDLIQYQNINKTKFVGSKVTDNGNGIVTIETAYEEPLAYLNGATPSKSTTSETYVDFDSTIDLTIAKRHSSTALCVDFRVNGIKNTVAHTRVSMGVRINDVDYDVCYFHIGDTVRKAFSGIAKITGLPAGTYTLRPRWRRVAGTGTLEFDSLSQFQYTVREVRG